MMHIVAATAEVYPQHKHHHHQTPSVLAGYQASPTNIHQLLTFLKRGFRNVQCLGLTKKFGLILYIEYFLTLKCLHSLNFVKCCRESGGNLRDSIKTKLTSFNNMILQ